MYRTKRLLIRRLEPRDKKPLTDLFSSPQVMAFIGPRRPLTEDETQVWLDRQMALQEIRLTRFGVELREIGELIGVCGYQFIDGGWDFGYYFRQAFWGHGYATEACICLLEKASDLLGGEDFVVFIAEDNLASQIVMKHCGYLPTKLATKDGERGAYFSAA